MLRKKVKFPITLEEISKDKLLLSPKNQHKGKESDEGSSGEEIDTVKEQLESKEALEELCFRLK